MNATLDLPVLPPSLYRYRKLTTDDDLENEVTAIKENYLWCSSYRLMNDPMEGLYKSSARLLGSQEYEKTVDHILNSKTQIGICCFTETSESELMWAHYASNYRGICVEYSVEPLIEGLPAPVHLVRLGYGDAPPRIGIQEVVDIKAAARRILSQKKNNWAYEREWRILGLLGKVPYSKKETVSKIYLGANILPSHKQRIVTEFASTTAISEMKVTGYEHDWRPLVPPTF
jgi:hypothetical protein